MGMCKECGEVFNTIDMVDGVCKNCLSPEFILERDLKDQREKDYNNNKKILNSIMVTTEAFINVSVEKRIGIVSSECVFGMNIIKDLFSFVRDIIGGRIKSVEDALREAKEEVITDLKKQAYFMGGDAVIAVKIEHTYNNTNSGNILSIFATGTVVKMNP